MASKPSIALVANTSWSIYKFRLYLIERLLKEGFHVFVLAPRDSYTPAFEHLEGVTYIALRHMQGKTISPFRDMLLYRELLRRYRTHRPDLIFHYTIKANLFGSLAATRAGIPSIPVITGLGYSFSGKGWLQSAAKLLYRRALPGTAEVWFLNDDDRHIFTKEKLVSAGKTFLLPGEGVDTAKFFPMPYEPGKKAVTFLLIGRLIRHKGIYEFVQAAQLLRQQGLSVHCQLLGFFDDGNPVAISREQVEDWTTRNLITYLGHADQVAPFIEQADCIVLPSYREGMPLSLLEGGSMCKALIAADTAGCRAIVDDGVNGWLCRARDGADLAEKMTAYYHLPADAKKQMGLAARKKVLENYTRERVSLIYLEKINALRIIRSSIV
jgi:glycosyltransferase involved in cell wall biosynthesis